MHLQYYFLDNDVKKVLWKEIAQPNNNYGLRLGNYQKSGDP